MQVTPKVVKSVLVTINRDLNHRRAQGVLGGGGGNPPFALVFTNSNSLLIITWHNGYK